MCRMTGSGPPRRKSLSVSAVTVETFESITWAWLGSGTGTPKNSSHAAGSGSKISRIVAS